MITMQQLHCFLTETNNETDLRKCKERLTCVENGDWRNATPFLGTSIRYPGGRKALKPKTRSGCPWKSCDTRFMTPGVSMLSREGADRVTEADNNSGLPQT